MLTTGQLLTTDDNSTVVWNVDNIARHMLAANIPFRIYAEGISNGYVGGNTGLYLIRHNPFAMLSDIASNPAVANQTIWPFAQFATDLANGTLPEFSFVVPDVNDDAHNGTPQQADSWLQTNVVIPLSNSPAFAPGGDGLLIVDFDEAADQRHHARRRPCSLRLLGPGRKDRLHADLQHALSAPEHAAYGDGRARPAESTGSRSVGALHVRVLLQK